MDGTNRQIASHDGHSPIQGPVEPAAPENTGSTKKCVAIRRHIPIGRIPTEFQATRRSTEDVASVRLSEEIVRAINTHKRRVQSASASPPIGLSTAPEPVIRRAVFATDALECAAP